MTTRSKTTTQQQTEVTRRDVERAFREASLTREEELVLRMRAGMAAPGSTALSFRGQESDEVSAKLAMLEAQAIRRVRRPVAVPMPSGGDALKQALIDKLKKI